MKNCLVLVFMGLVIKCSVWVALCSLLKGKESLPELGLYEQVLYTTNQTRKVIRN